MKSNMVRRTVVMLVGILFLGLGVALFKLSLTGNDPCSALNMTLVERTGISFSYMLIITNCLWFAFEIIFGRKLIGIGTVANWFGVGFTTTLWMNLISPIIPVPENFFGQIALLLAGVLVLSCACSLYQTADLGIAPYDSLSLMLSKRFPIPYFWCRMFTDSVCIAIALCMGGMVGLGTLVSAFGLGPFVAFFTKYVARRLCGYTD